jgi:predicted nucleic acid-binding protein
MHRLFLDANILFSAAYQHNARMVALWKFQDVVLCSSRYALAECMNNLAEEHQRERLEALSASLGYFDAKNYVLPKGIVLPEKDVPILSAAIEARANYLLTGDFTHFGPYFGKKIENVTIVPPARYFKIRDQERKR